MSYADKGNIQLSQDERKRIRAEEIFRNEVRAQIATAKGPQKLHQRLWAARNSAFTLWLLSSVVLATVSWSYSQWEKNRSVQRRAELDYGEFANQAAFAMDGLQKAIMAHRSIVEQYIKGNIRKVGRLHYRFAMMDNIEAGLKAAPRIDTSLKKLRGQMNKAGSDASSAFRLWVEYAVGDDVDARKKVIEDLIKRKSGRKQQFEDYAQALAHKDEKLFVLVEEAIKWKVFLKHHDNKMEHLADTVARKTSDLRSASKGFVPISDLEPWLGEIPSLVGDIVDFNYMIRIYSAIESGISIRMRFGISEDSFGRATLSDVMDNYKRDDIIFGLIQLELAEAKSLQVDVEMERARISSIEDSMQRLSAAINTAEELNKAVRTELVMLHSGSWLGNASEIPRLTQTLKQRTRFSVALNDDVPEDIVNLEKEAKTEIAQSWAYLERIIERANK